jgi:outer membrane protein assembly factor BamB
MAAITTAFGQPQAPSEITVGGVHIKGVPMDWSHRHVVFSNPGTEAEAIKAGTHDRWLKIVNDPRYVIQQLQRQQSGQGPTGAQVASLLAAAPPSDDTPDKKRKHRDWSMDLGTGSIPANTFPAKWSFGTTTANCASDFVMFPAGKNGSPSQATIVAYNNLYAGCGGTVPSVYWQYNANSIGSDLSPVLSADGTQVAFMSHNLGGGSIVPDTGGSDALVILKWAANSSLVSLSPVSAASYRNCTAPCMTTLGPIGSDANSSPFYDYANDAIYVGDSSGALHKFTGVFNGTPAVASSPWPVAVAGSGISSPVLDAVSGLVMVGSLNGSLYSVNSSTGAVAGASHQLDTEYGIYDAPLVDSSAGMVYAFAGYDGNPSCSDGKGHTGCSGVFQFPVGFTSGAGTETQVGLGYLPLFSGAFDNAYYNSSNASSPTGNLYVCGQTDTNAQQTLSQIPIASNVMGSEVASSYLVGNGADCSPVTEFYNTSVATDYLFLSSEAAYQGCTQSAGCLFGFNVTSGTVPDSAEFGAATGGTSGIVVDNSVGSGTLAGASQIYFTTLSDTGTCATSGGTGICGVQDSQTSLYVDWSEFHNTLDHQGFNQYENVLSPSTVGSLGLDWSYTTGNGVYSSPAVANGVVYVGSGDDKVYALNASTGALLWSYTTGNAVLSSPAVANGVVYVGSDDDKVYALNASTGAKLWSYTTGFFVESSPAVANGVVYVGSYDDKVYALNASTGALLWSYTTGSYVTSAPAVANGVVYVGSIDDNVYALNASTGALLWSYTTGYYVTFAPAVANGVVYVGSDDDKVYALNASTGALLWSYTTGSAVESSPAVANGVVYVGSDDGKVYALNASTGALLWSYTTGSVVYSSPAVANGVVYVGSEDEKVYALNAATGALLWSYTTGNSVLSSPAVANGVVYVGSYDDKVYAFALP